MPRTAQEVLDALVDFIEEKSMKRSVDAVFFREDYGDFQVVLDDKYHCEIREKLIDVFFDNPKHTDTRMEIAFLIKNAIEYEEWEDSPTGGGGGGADDIVLD